MSHQKPVLVPPTGGYEWRKRALVLFLLMFVCMAIGFLRPPKSHQQAGGLNGTRSSDLIYTLCNKTLYFDVCNSSLSGYPGALQAVNMSELVRIAVELNLNEARQVVEFTADLNGTASAGICAAIEDCVEVLDDMVDELCASVSVVTEPNWKQRADDVKTWLSAALTDPSTCLQGFEDVDEDIQQTMKEKLDYLTQLTSNALAIVNYVSTTEEELTWKWVPNFLKLVDVF